MNEFMERAIALAKISAAEGEVPVGAVVVKDNVIVGEGRNRRELGKNALYHAETEAIDNACKTLGGWRLWQCEMYVTLEPCPMCAGAIINSRIKRVTFGAYDLKAGSFGSVINFNDLPYNHKPEIIGGVNEEECKQLLTDFFKVLREKKVSSEVKPPLLFSCRKIISALDYPLAILKSFRPEKRLSVYQTHYKAKRPPF